MTLVNTIDFEAARYARDLYWAQAGDDPCFMEADRPVHGPVTFRSFAADLLPGGEARSLTPTGSGPAACPISPVAQRDRPPSTERPA